jgi:ArsR family transcriptional regulator, arsenate/arsenite/antimonite-responsive transcriptional repressor
MSLIDDAVLKALSDPTRRQILKVIGDGELKAGEIAAQFSITAPSMSHHFAVLKEAQLVKVRRDGTTLYYSLNTTVAQECLARLWELFGKTIQTTDIPLTPAEGTTQP